MLPAVGLALCFATSASAQLALTGSVKYLTWREATSPIEVHEGGPLLALGLRYEAPLATMVRWSYDGRLSMGWAAYNGSYLGDPSTPATGTSEWLETAHALDLHIGPAHGAQGIAGLGLAAWRRQLGARQEESYRMASVRLGLGSPAPAPRGWRAGGGLDVPFVASEDAHFDQLGFDENPKLEPGLEVGGFAHVAYRATEKWTWALEWEMRRLGQSGGVPLTVNGRRVGVTFQPATVMNTLGVRVDWVAW